MGRLLITGDEPSIAQVIELPDAPIGAKHVIAARTIKGVYVSMRIESARFDFDHPALRAFLARLDAPAAAEATVADIIHAATEELRSSLRAETSV